MSECLNSSGQQQQRYCNAALQALQPLLFASFTQRESETCTDKNKHNKPKADAHAKS
jgi:hypothetical protein